MAPTDSSNISAPGKEDDGLKIIHAGLFRTGTASMAEAYRVLGYKAHHGLEDVLGNPWSRIEQAAEATWPHLSTLPDYTYKREDGSAVPRPPFTRADWQSIWGDYDVATDVASPFVLELITAYPDAKVVVVQRSFDAWWPSFRSELLDTLYHSGAWIQKLIGWHVLRIRSMHAMKKVHAGFFSAEEYSKESIEPRAREAYDEYYRKVREAVPLETGRRLEYTLGSGWGPLCEFLGKDIPDAAFPRVNDRQSHGDEIGRINAKMYSDAVKKVGPFVAAMAAVAIVYSRW
ncbi:hypothetical protein F66182_6321 [Fusarium sp. NRRL 66182]|nr:hypothetical protein F66182_6321 [Fusarium sp. NRRL 66182]